MRAIEGKMIDYRVFIGGKAMSRREARSYVFALESSSALLNKPSAAGTAPSSTPWVRVSNSPRCQARRRRQVRVSVFLRSKHSNLVAETHLFCLGLTSEPSMRKRYDPIFVVKIDRKHESYSETLSTVNQLKSDCRWYLSGMLTL
ncbi:hypothetical protein AKJ16_DCAP16725 [Drosera capensis]